MTLKPWHCSLFVSLVLLTAACGDDSTGDNNQNDNQNDNQNNACQDTCSQGAGRCSGDTLERCQMGQEGCLVWVVETDCADAGAVCDDSTVAACLPLPVCGNTVLEQGEVCDGTDLGGETCAGLGYDGGSLACTTDCAGLDAAGCHRCGDDLAAGPEVCDGTDLGDETCVGLGYDGGSLACATDCAGLDAAGCHRCGDDLVAGPEVCDGTDLGGETCAGLGYDGGSLACATDCAGFDTSGCVFDTCSVLLCSEEAPPCTGKKVNLVVVLDYSTSMNTLFDTVGGRTRWEVISDSFLEALGSNTCVAQDDLNLSILRFGHDPAPSTLGTIIAGETSGLVDGQAVDVTWYDSSHLPGYDDCNARSALLSLQATIPPMNGGAFGIGTWTRGAMLRAQSLITLSKADHPTDTDRVYAVLVITDGAWTGVDGTTTLSPASENPALVAADLFNTQAIMTFVVAVATDPAAKAAADALAAAGGTTQAQDASTPALTTSLIQSVLQSIEIQSSLSCP